MSEGVKDVSVVSVEGDPVKESDALPLVDDGPDIIHPEFVRVPSQSCKTKTMSPEKRKQLMHPRLHLRCGGVPSYYTFIRHEDREL